MARVARMRVEVGEEQQRVDQAVEVVRDQHQRDTARDALEALAQES